MSTIDQHGPLVRCRNLLWTLLWERRQTEFFQANAVATPLFLWPWQILASRWRKMKDGDHSWIERRQMKLALDEDELRTSDQVWWYFHQRGISDLTVLNPFVIPAQSFGKLVYASDGMHCDLQRIVDAENLIPKRFLIFVKGKQLHFLPVISQPDDCIFETSAVFASFPRDLSSEGLRFVDSHRQMVEAAWKLESEAKDTRREWLAWSDANADFDRMLGAKLVQQNMLSTYDSIGRFMFHSVKAKRHLAAFEKETPILAWSPYYAPRFDFLSTMRRLCGKLSTPWR